LRAEARALGFGEEPEHDLGSYYHAFVESFEAAGALRDKLLNEKGISYAAVQGQPSPAVYWDAQRMALRSLVEVEGVTIPKLPTPYFNSNQGYLSLAPDGIGVKSAWDHPGGYGDGVNIVDIEWGWNLAHEDLMGLNAEYLFGERHRNDHGTSVLGLIAGRYNNAGVDGIAAGASIKLAPAWYDSDRRKWNFADALNKVVGVVKERAVILLEMHAPGPNTPNPETDDSQKGYVSCEFWLDEFNAIRQAAARNYIVEAAGNGGEDLDAPVYKDVFQRVVLKCHHIVQ
jgi:hypothetical protein